MTSFFSIDATVTREDWRGFGPIPIQSTKYTELKDAKLSSSKEVVEKLRQWADEIERLHAWRWADEIERLHAWRWADEIERLISPSAPDTQADTRSA